MTRDGKIEVILPDIGTVDPDGFPMTVRGIRYLPNNKYLVFADINSTGLVRLDLSDFTKLNLLSGFNQPNGLAIDSDGFAYMTGGDSKVVRVDPDSGDDWTLHADEFTTDGIVLSLDFETLYFNHEMSDVYKMKIHEDGTSEEAELLTRILDEELGEESLLDGMAMDACGNLYVVEMMGVIWRVHPKTGETEKVVELEFGDDDWHMINAINFGSGIGGWKEDAIYIGSMEGKLYEVELGVPGAPQPHLQ
jgi:sugar lactone lactonase YvrE